MDHEDFSIFLFYRNCEECGDEGKCLLIGSFEKHIFLCFDCIIRHITSTPVNLIR